MTYVGWFIIVLLLSLILYEVHDIKAILYKQERKQKD